MYVYVHTVSVLRKPISTIHSTFDTHACMLRSVECRMDGLPYYTYPLLPISLLSQGPPPQVADSQWQDWFLQHSLIILYTTLTVHNM